MESKPRTRAAGSIIAIAILVGVIGGIAAGEPSIGFLAGFGIGAAFALLLWLRDRRNP